MAPNQYRSISEANSPSAARKGSIFCSVIISAEMLYQQDPAHFAFRIIYHAAVIVPHHRLAADRVAGRPGQSGLARIARASKVHPGGGHLLREGLRLGRIARALLATL